MATHLLSIEIRRYAAAAAPSTRGLLVLGAMRLVTAPVLVAHLTLPANANETTQQLIEAMTSAWNLAVLVMFARLAVSLVRAARQPARDAEAADHLQSLRDRAIIEGHALVEIHRTLWASQAGQQALSLNITTGQVSELWLPEMRLPDGSFAMITTKTAGGRTSIVGWAHPEQIASAHRERHRQAMGQLAKRRRKGLQPAIASTLLAEAERATRERR